jgi:hypothetical protein
VLELRAELRARGDDLESRGVVVFRARGVVTATG